MAIVSAFDATVRLGILVGLCLGFAITLRQPLPQHVLLAKFLLPALFLAHAATNLLLGDSQAGAAYMAGGLTIIVAFCAYYASSKTTGRLEALLRYVAQHRDTLPSAAFLNRRVVYEQQGHARSLQFIVMYYSALRLLCALVASRETDYPWASFVLAEVGDGLMATVCMRTLLSFPAKRSVRSPGYRSGMRAAGLVDYLDGRAGGALRVGQTSSRADTESDDQEGRGGGPPRQSRTWARWNRMRRRSGAAARGRGQGREVGGADGRQARVGGSEGRVRGAGRRSNGAAASSSRFDGRSHYVGSERSRSSPRLGVRPARDSVATRTSGTAGSERGLAGRQGTIDLRLPDILSRVASRGGSPRGAAGGGAQVVPTTGSRSVTGDTRSTGERPAAGAEAGRAGAGRPESRAGRGRLTVLQALGLEGYESSTSSASSSTPAVQSDAQRGGGRSRGAAAEVRARSASDTRGISTGDRALNRHGAGGRRGGRRRAVEDYLVVLPTLGPSHPSAPGLPMVNREVELAASRRRQRRAAAAGEARARLAMQMGIPIGMLDSSSSSEDESDLQAQSLDRERDLAVGGNGAAGAAAHRNEGLAYLPSGHRGPAGNAGDAARHHGRPGDAYRDHRQNGSQQVPLPSNDASSVPGTNTTGSGSQDLWAWADRQQNEADLDGDLGGARARRRGAAGARQQHGPPAVVSARLPGSTADRDGRGDSSPAKRGSYVFGPSGLLVQLRDGDAAERRGRKSSDASRERVTSHVSGLLKEHAAAGSRKRRLSQVTPEDSGYAPGGNSEGGPSTGAGAGDDSQLPTAADSAVTVRVSNATRSGAPAQREAGDQRVGSDSGRGTSGALSSWTASSTQGAPLLFREVWGSARLGLAAIGCPPIERPSLVLRPGEAESKSAGRLAGRRGGGPAGGKWAVARALLVEGPEGGHAPGSKGASARRLLREAAGRAAPAGPGAAFRDAVMGAAIGLPNRTWLR